MRALKTFLLIKIKGSPHCVRATMFFLSANKGERFIFNFGVYPAKLQHNAFSSVGRALIKFKSSKER